jgi:hypothetical protein
MRSWTSLAFALCARAILNPRVALDLLSLAWSMRRRGWYARAPFFPIPPAEYMRWRMHTAYGDESAVPPVRDVLRFARWRRDLLRR